MNSSTKSFLEFELCQVKIKIYLLLLIICIVGYWPVSLNLFALKNDATMYFLPYRYQISSAIRNWEFPFWSPYLYMGFPIHADMQSGAWNPVVLMISLFTTYNMSVLHFESLLYVFIAGIGMYKLLNEFGIENRIKFVIAVSYMFSGFITDSGQFIVWLASAAFIPFVFLYFYRILYQPAYLNAFKAAIALCMLFWAGYPSFLIYCCYILMAALIVRLFEIIRNKNFILLKNILLRQFVFVILFLLMSLPALISFLEMLPYYSRGISLTLNRALTDPFSIKCTTSFFIPFNLSREDIGFGTDPTMRNTFTGIFSMAFFIFSFSRKMNSLRRFVFFIFIVTFLFTLGDATPLREFTYRFIPLMDYFRHPANMRLFSSICILFAAGLGMQDFFNNRTSSTRKKMMNIYVLLIIILSSIIFFFWAYSGGSFNIASFPDDGFGRSNWRDGLKQLFYGISFPFTILIVGIFQILFVFSAMLLEKKNSFNRYFPALIIINVMAIAQLSLPATFVSKVPPGAINSFIKKFPSGYPTDKLKIPVMEDTSRHTLYDPLVFGYESYYNKKIEIPTRITTPCILSSTDSFLNNPAEKKLISGHPVFHFRNMKMSESNSIEINEFRSNGFSISASADEPRQLDISQNYYKHWKATIDGRPTAISRTNISFMSILIPTGRHEVRFEYAPYNIYIAMVIAWVAFIASSCYFIFIHLKIAGGKNKI
jgi:uncharacterized membrane protein